MKTKMFSEQPGLKNQKILFALKEMSIIEFLLNRALFQVKDVQFRILEIEIYDDDYCHRAPQQMKLNVFYFHPKGGTRKGLDFTMVKNGGVLIRSVQRVKTKEIIEGPSLVVDTVLAIYPEARELNGKDIFTLEMKVIETELEPKIIYSTPRVGLSLKFKDGKINPMIGRPLRYLTDLRMKKGRIQIIFGLRDKSIDKIHLLTNYTKASIRQYLPIFENPVAPISLRTNADLANLFGNLKKYYS